MPQIDAKINRLLEGPGGTRKGAYRCLFAPLGRFWLPFWVLLAAQRVSKSYFSHKISKSRKNGGPKARPEQTLKLNRNLVPKWEAGGSKIERFALYLFQNRRFSGCVKKYEKWEPKLIQKATTIDPQNVRKLDFFDFGAF